MTKKYKFDTLRVLLTRQNLVFAAFFSFSFSFTISIPKGMENDTVEGKRKLEKVAKKIFLGIKKNRNASNCFTFLMKSSAGTNLVILYYVAD
jgi:hypothetical protein